jgi:hypothetical protein
MAATLYAVNKGFLDDIDVKKVLAFEARPAPAPEVQPRRAAGQAGERQGHGQGRRRRADERHRRVQEVLRLT